MYSTVLLLLMPDRYNHAWGPTAENTAFLNTLVVFIKIFQTPMVAVLRRLQHLLQYSQDQI